MMLTKSLLRKKFNLGSQTGRNAFRTPREGRHSPRPPRRRAPRVPPPWSGGCQLVGQQFDMICHLDHLAADNHLLAGAPLVWLQVALLHHDRLRALLTRVLVVVANNGTRSIASNTKVPVTILC